MNITKITAILEDNSEVDLFPLAPVVEIPIVPEEVIPEVVPEVLDENKEPVTQEAPVEAPIETTPTE